MKQNKYDDNAFYNKYSQMDRSTRGLAGAGEWHALQKMLPPLAGKRVLDLGCGFGWHCAWAMAQGAQSATGVDLSENMLDRAREMNGGPGIAYLRAAIEDIDFPENSFDLVFSSLAFHYVESFDAVCRRVHGCLAPGGAFVFSAEHPIFTAQGPQRWHTDSAGANAHWPVDRYFDEGMRQAVFLEEVVVKYHRTLTTYLSDLLHTGFTINGVCEPQPSRQMLEELPAMADELRRPMMLIVSATKN